MSLLNSQFDIVSVDNPVALASLAQVLAVASPPSPSVDTNGTPVAGAIQPGMFVTMDSAGKAILATTPAMGTQDPLLVFVTVDGNTDYSGSFVQKLTVLHGGVTIRTDQFAAGTYTPGVAVSVNAGKLKVAATGDQVIGWVGPSGQDTVNGWVEVVLPQGCAFAKK